MANGTDSIYGKNVYLISCSGGWAKAVDIWRFIFLPKLVLLFSIYNHVWQFVLCLWTLNHSWILLSSLPYDRYLVSMSYTDKTAWKSFSFYQFCICHLLATVNAGVVLLFYLWRSHSRTSNQHRLKQIYLWCIYILPYVAIVTRYIAVWHATVTKWSCGSTRNWQLCHHSGALPLF